jgi:ribose transport system substrate-binding protein
MRTRKRAAMLAGGLLSTLALVLAGCGDSSGEAETVDVSAADANKVYAEGVPTLNELYAAGPTLPSTDGPPPKAGANVWWISCGQAIEGCSAPAEAGKEAAEKLGFDFHIADGGLDKNGGVAGAIRTAVAGGAEAMVLWGVSCESVNQPITEARDSGVIVMGAHADNCDQYDGDGGGNSAVTEWFDQMYSASMPTALEFWDGVGRTAAQYIIDATQGKAKVLLNSGNYSTIKALDDGFRAELAKCEGCEIVSTLEWGLSDLGPNGPWAQAFRSKAIADAGKYNAVYFPFDGFFLEWGGLDSLEQAGVKDVITVGGLGLPATIQAVRDGDITAMPTALPNDMQGWAAMDAINRALNNEPRTPQGYGFTLIDKDHNLPAEGEEFLGNVDFKSAYLESWGLSS